MNRLGSCIAETVAMVRILVPLASVVVMLSGPAIAYAQPPGAPLSPTPQEPPPKDPSSKVALAKRFKVDQGGGFHFSKHFAVVFGGIKAGSGAALGGAVSQESKSGAYTQFKGVYSINNFKLLQLRYDLQPISTRKIVVSTRVRWQDAPRLALYHLGPESANRREFFKERRTDVSGVVRVPLAVKTVLLGGTGVEWFKTSGGWDDPLDQVVDGVPQAPGLGTEPSYLHSFAEIADDTRLSPDYSRTGHMLDAAFHHYHDTAGTEQSFQRVTFAAYQLLPTFSQRGAIGFGARAWLSNTAEGQQVPVFMMATLGGGDYLRGYPTYRFRDRHAVLLQAEYRYAVHKRMDVAALYETGAVSPTVGSISAKRFDSSVGAGIRVHSKTSGLLRMDFAHGRDGWKVAFGVGVGGA
jgi:hypothetical protein